MPDARELPGAVPVLVALLLPAVGPPGAPGDVGVAAAAPRALAQEGPGTVDADGAAAARAVQTLVHVLAARQRVPGEALLAEALRGAGGSALGVQAAAEAVAGALAPVAVLREGKTNKTLKYQLCTQKIVKKGGRGNNLLNILTFQEFLILELSETYQVVDVERRRADAGSRDASLVLPAASASRSSPAGSPGGGADPGEGIAGGAVGAEAGEGSGGV